MTSLKKYKNKRNFSSSPEPEGKIKKSRKKFLRFVIQKHDATRLHYDLRLEINGVFKSWAVPKGPAMKGGEKHLAVLVEDHPMEYGKFEGIIPKGNYGAGTVMIWDKGEYSSVDDKGGDQNQLLQNGFDKGDLKFILNGEKLKGEFVLVRIAKSAKGNEWLLIKKKDEFATDEGEELDDVSVVSGRTMEEIKNKSEAKHDVWNSSSHNLLDSLPKGAKKGNRPTTIIPMMAKLEEELSDSDDWLYEVKWDGYRAIANIHFKDVKITSRNEKSFNKKFTLIKDSLEEWAVDAIVDGEICVLDEEGNSEFSLIQNYERTRKGTLVYYVFDILYYEGYDFMEVPLYKRKEFLKKIIPADHPVILYSDHVRGNGKDFFELAKEMNLEGVIGKQRLSTYVPASRSSQWLKFKNILEQEVVIAGYTSPKGGRKKFGALIMGAYSHGKLEYIGSVGTGFDDHLLNSIHQKLSAIVITKCPFNEELNLSGVTWVEPNYVAQVKFQEWTNDGLLRQPVFLGLRNDKTPQEVSKELINNRNNKSHGKTKRSTKTKSKKNTTFKSEDKQKKTGRTAVKRERAGIREKSKEGKRVKTIKKSSDEEENFLSSTIVRKREKSSGMIPLKFLDNEKNEAHLQINSVQLKLTNLNKVYWPKEGYTKGDLINYYYQISDYILPYILDKPQSLRRNPNGIDKDSFFQKDMPETIPDWLTTKKIYSDTNKKDINYLVCSNKETLVYMANLGCIEINTWFSKIQSLTRPDFFVLDLDPLEVEFDLVIRTAQVIKEFLDSLDIKSYCKTSGSKGLHICIPTGRKYTYDILLKFSEILANRIHSLIPDITSIERLPSKRKNKVYIDYLQNREAQTIAAPYCIRPVEGAKVSTPLEWKEVKKGLNPKLFTIETIFQRLNAKGDLFKGIFEDELNIEEAMRKM